MKSKLSCNIILNYRQKKRGRWPAVDISIPKEGITKEDLIVSKIHRSLDPKLFKLENRKGQSVEIVMPGTPVLWMKKI